jgi:hypothetical protein
MKQKELESLKKGDFVVATKCDTHQPRSLKRTVLTVKKIMENNPGYPKWMLDINGWGWTCKEIDFLKEKNDQATS